MEKNDRFLSHEWRGAPIGDTHTQLHFPNNTKMMRGGFGTDGKAMVDQLLPLSNNFLLHGCG